MDLRDGLPALLDADAHVMAPMDRWEELYGPVARPLLQRFGPETPAASMYAGPELPADPDAVWSVKGASAPSAGALEGRPAVLDLMGVARQLVFPDPLAWLALLDRDPSMRAAEGRRHYARWVGDQTRALGRRVRPAAVLGADTPEGLVAEAEEALAEGARAVLVASARPPGGRDPGGPEHDALYRLLASADVPLLLHLGGEAGFHEGGPWADVRGVDLALADFVGGEPISPTVYATRSAAAELFLTLLVLGGALTRHPRLRLGAMELGGGWVGPLAARLDLAAELGARVLADRLDDRPSAQLARQLRVTPFRWEPVEALIADPVVGPTLCFSTDFPHREGGRDPIGDFARRLRHAAPAERAGFFSGHARWVLPDDA